MTKLYVPVIFWQQDNSKVKIIKASAGKTCTSRAEAELVLDDLIHQFFHYNCHIYKAVVEEIDLSQVNNPR